MGVTEGVDVILGNCTILSFCYTTYLTKDQPPPSTLLVVFSTMQYSTIEIII